MSSCSTEMARLKTAPTGLVLPAHLRDGTVETGALTRFVLPVGAV